MSKKKEPVPSRFQIWKCATRPHTLTASVAPLFVSYAVTLRLIQQHPDLCGGDNIRCLAEHPLRSLTMHIAAFAFLIQIGTNLHNDYADFVKGADTDKRVGQARATQKGWLTPYETCRGCVLCLLGALFIGIHYLIPSSKQCLGNNNGNNNSLDIVVALLVFSSVFNAVAYTGGPFPLGYIGLGNISIGYSGLGDLFVFLYFGIVVTVSVPYLYATKVACHAINQQLLQLLHYPLLCSLPIGFLATAIIVVNNLRDRHTDILAGKRTTAVRFGSTFAKMEYFGLVVGSYAFCFYFYLLETRSTGATSKHLATTLLPLLSFPMAIPQLKAVSFGGKDGQRLNEHVGGTAKLQLVYCILMMMGLLIR